MKFLDRHRGMVAVALWLVTWLLLNMAPVYAQKLPNDAPQYLPVLVGEIDTYWPRLEVREVTAGLVEQESLWKLKATLKTEREFGCGFGQFTRTFNKDGSVRFDALTDTKRLDKSLAAWSWSDCYNATFQLRAMVLKLKQNERSCAVWMKGVNDIKKCDLSGYNGGMGGVSSRIRLCRATPGCDPSRWDEHLAKQCTASKVKQAGYGESFCEINSKYPGRVFARMPKYAPYMTQKPN